MNRHIVPMQNRFVSASRRALLIALSLGLALTFPAMAEDTANLDEIIACHIESRGGRDAMDSAKSARMSGKMALGPGMEAPFVINFKRPNKLRMEFEFQGMKAVQAYDAESGWGIMPFLGQTEPTVLADDQLKQVQDQSDFDGHLVDYKDKGHTVEHLGTVDADGTEAHKIKITKANGDVITTYLDTEYCLEFKQESRTSIQGNEVNVIVEVGDYKDVGNGLMMAHSYNQTMEGAPAGQAITFESVELNPELEDAFFAMPEAEEKVEEAADGAGE